MSKYYGVVIELDSSGFHYSGLCFDSLQVYTQFAHDLSKEPTNTVICLYNQYGGLISYRVSVFDYIYSPGFRMAQGGSYDPGSFIYEVFSSRVGF